MLFVWVAGSLPPEWEDLTQLSVLSLQNNTLTGTLPPSWGKGMRALRELRLAFNNVRGAQMLREEMCYQPTLRHTFLSCQTLTLQSAKCMIKSCLLTGTLPSAWSELRNLTYLEAPYNSIEGGIPACRP